MSSPAPSEKATAQSKMLDLGSHNSLPQHDMYPIFFSKITTLLLSVAGGALAGGETGKVIPVRTAHAEDSYNRYRSDHIGRMLLKEINFISY